MSKYTRTVDSILHVERTIVTSFLKVMKRTVVTNSEDKPLFVFNVCWIVGNTMIFSYHYVIKKIYTHPEFKPALPLDGHHGLHS